jgi:hypothetical protein
MTVKYESINIPVAGQEFRGDLLKERELLQQNGGCVNIHS